MIYGPLSGKRVCLSSEVRVNKMSGGCPERTKRFFGAITIEPVYLLFTLSHGLYTLVAQELYIMKARGTIR